MSTKSILVALVAGLFAIGGCGSEPMEPATDLHLPTLQVSSDPDTMYKLTGQGDYYEAGGDPDLLIVAVRHFDGSLSGDVSDPANARYGPVVGLIPPTEASDTWCVEVALTDIPDFVVVLYVKDRNGVTALDQFHTGGGFGLSCANYSAPEGEFTTLLDGDFKGSINVRK